MKALQLLGLVLIIILVINFVLFVAGKVSTTLFWSILIIAGIASFAMRYTKSIKKGKKRK